MKFEKTTLGAISSNIQTGPFGSQLHQSDYSESGVPVIMPKDLVEGKISTRSIAKVEQHHVNRLKKYIVSLGDIIYSRRGDVGRCAYVDADKSGWLCGTGCLRVTVNSEKALSKYVLYFLKLSSTISWVEKHAVGSTMLNLNTKILSEVPVYIPNKDVQQKVISILNAYDELIVNNQRQIDLLEEIANRLYKEWFIDFRFPGFKDMKIIDEIPAGWTKKSIDDVFTIKYGKTLPKSKITESGRYPVYGANGVIGFYSEKNIDDYRVLITSRGNGSGDVLRTHDKEAFVTNNSFIVHPREEYLKVSYVYQLMKTLGFANICTGSAQPQLTNNSISKLLILMPPRGLIDRYCSVGDLVGARIESLISQNKLLVQAQNRLLPKLLNGEIEV